MKEKTQKLLEILLILLVLTLAISGLIAYNYIKAAQLPAEEGFNKENSESSDIAIEKFKYDFNRTHDNSVLVFSVEIEETSENWSFEPEKV